MSRRFLVGLFFSVFAPISTPALANKVWIVDASGGGDFTQIQPAIDAAVDRDTVLIESGTYGGFTIDGETLAVVGDSGATILVNGQVTIRNIPIGKFVVLGGFPVNVNGATALRVLGNPGAIRIQAASFVGHPEAVRVENSTDVDFTECTMRGRLGIAHQRGGDGLIMISSAVALYDCEVLGGAGGPGSVNPCSLDGGAGGNGCRVSNGFFFASRTNFYAGDGGHGANGDCWSCGGPGWGGDGGAGIATTLSAGNFLGCVAQGGAGGQPGCNWDCSCGGSNGIPGPAIDDPSQIQVISGTPRRMTAPLVVRATSTVALEFWGLGGDVVHFYLARQTDFEFSLPRRGVFILPPASTPRVMGTMDASGQLSKSLVFPNLGGNAQSRTYFLQSLHRVGAADRTLGTGRSLVVIDSGI